jgi:hypothetical protein
MAQNQNQQTRATDAQRDAMREEMRNSAEKFKKKAAGSLFQTFVEHVQSPEGKVIRDFGSMVDGLTNGLLSKAVKGMMTPDEDEKKPVGNANGITIKVKEPKH